MKHMKTAKAAAFCALISTVLTTSTRAAVLANYAIGTPGQETTAETGAPYAATTTAQFVTATPIADTAGTIGLECSSAATTPANAPFLRIDPQGNSASAAVAISGNKYFTFTVAPTPGHFLALSSLTFNGTRGGGGTPRGYVVRSSVDNFGADLSGGDFNTARPTYTAVTVDLSGAAYQNLSTITFRIYVYSPGAGSSVDFDDFVVNGTAPAVPDTNIYSPNAVGYVNLALTPGFKLISNPLNSTNNTIGNLLVLPRFSQLFKWNGTGFDSANFTGTGWDHPEYTLTPGEGAFVNVASATSVTFFGEVMQGTLNNNLPVGFSIRGSQVPQLVDVTTAGLTAALKRFDQVFDWDAANQTYISYSLTGNGWSPSTPNFDATKPLFISSASGGTMTRSFSVNQ
ncbi:MAG: endonuclease/exonuclease/phosphatase [Verrucomicrobiales bacterium]|nr:endonuclease/exonuclease/phosphatase [Verrucomicrobiales bacterium]